MPPVSRVVQLVWMPARWNSGTDSRLTVPGWPGGSSVGSRPVSTSRFCRLAMTERCDMTTPRAVPVVPDENMIRAGSSSATGTGSRAAGPGAAGRRPPAGAARPARGRGPPGRGTAPPGAGLAGQHQHGRGLIQGRGRLGPAPPRVAEHRDGAQGLRRPERDDPLDLVEPEQHDPLARPHAQPAQVRRDPGHGAGERAVAEPALALDEELALRPASRAGQQFGQGARPPGVRQAGMAARGAGHDLPPPARFLSRRSPVAG